MITSSWGRPERGCVVRCLVRILGGPSRLRPGERRRALGPQGEAGRVDGALRGRPYEPAGLPSARISGRTKASHASGFSKSYVSSAGSIWLIVPFASAGS